MAILLGFGVLSCVGCSIIAHYGIKREVARTPRDPVTGIILGAEERDLGSPESPSAALLVHGFVGDGTNFGDLPDRLAALGWRVRVIRLPGHGTDPRDFAKTTADEIVAKVRDEILALKKSHARVAVIGHSMGCAASTLAVSETGADALVWGAPYFGVSYKWYYVLRVETWNALFSPFIRWVYRTKGFIRVHCKEQRDKVHAYSWLPTHGAATLMDLGRQAGKQETLQKISCPVYWIHAKDDNAADYEAASRAYEQLASAEKRHDAPLHSDHHIYLDCDREEVMRNIEQFLGKP